MLRITDLSHPLYSVTLKLDRAREQLKSLRTEIEISPKSDVHEIETQIDLKTELVLGVLRIKKPFPPIWSAIIGEIIHNLRCALDYLVFQLVILETRATPSQESKVQFPIFLTESGFDRRGVPTMLKGVGIDARAIIKSLQPFATGEGEKSPLWLLSQLSNWDKHRSISLTGANTHRVFTHHQVGNEGGGLFTFPMGIFKDNTPLFGHRVPPGPAPFLERARKVKVEGKVTFYIVFKEPLIMQGLSVSKTLGTLGTRIFAVCKRITEEIFKL